MKKKTREKKFQCEFAGDVKARGWFVMNCYALGCLHQINGDCPIIKEVQKNE